MYIKSACMSVLVSSAGVIPCITKAYVATCIYHERFKLRSHTTNLSSETPFAKVHPTMLTASRAQSSKGLIHLLRPAASTASVLTSRLASSVSFPKPSATRPSRFQGLEKKLPLTLDHVCRLLYPS